MIQVSALVFSQASNNLEAYQHKYPGETAFIKNDIENIRIDYAESGFKITQEVQKETYFLKNPTDYMITDKVYLTHFNKILDLDARTLIPDGKDFRIQKVTQFTDQKDQPDFVFYDEVIARKFVFPSVQPGAITSLHYSEELTDPHVLGSFFFKWHIPCEISQLCIKSDKRVKLKYKLYNTEGVPLDFSVQEKGKYNIYTWTVKDIKPSDYEEDAPDYKYFFPHIAFYIENSNTGNSLSNSGTGLDELYAYYYNLVKNVNLKEDTAINLQVKNIIAGANSEVEKVKRIYYWVQDNIQYVAFEAGMQGVIPESASQVYLKRYGDCKGMASLLSFMLKSAGIQAHLTWVGTRDIPYKYTEIPSSISDNHMIVTYYQDNKPIFLDATNKYLKYGIPSSMTQGKEALVAMDDVKYKVENIPVEPADENTIQDSVSVSLSGKTVFGSGTVSRTGYEKHNATYYLTDKKQKDKKDYLLGILNKGNNKFYLDTFIISNLADREEPLKINFSFRIEDYIKNINNEIYINMNLNRWYNNLVYDPAKRDIPVESPNMNQYKSIVQIRIPEGYAVSYLPKNVSSSGKYLQFSITYELKDNCVIQTRTFQKQFLILRPADFEDWNQVVNNLSQAYREVLILKKN